VLLPWDDTEEFAALHSGLKAELFPSGTSEEGRAKRSACSSLRNATGIGIMTIHQLEKDGSQPRRATLDVVRRAFELAGVEFIEENGGGPGVRLRKSGKERPPQANVAPDIISDNKAPVFL